MLIISHVYVAKVISANRSVFWENHTLCSHLIQPNKNDNLSKVVISCPIYLFFFQSNTEIKTRIFYVVRICYWWTFKMKKKHIPSDIYKDCYLIGRALLSLKILPFGFWYNRKFMFYFMLILGICFVIEVSNII